MDVAAHVSFWSLSFDHWRVSSDRYCAACYGSRFIIWSLEIEIASPFLSLSNLSVFVFVIFIQRKRQLIARKDQIFLRYVCRVDINVNRMSVHPRERRVCTTAYQRHSGFRFGLYAIFAVEEFSFCVDFHNALILSCYEFDQMLQKNYEK